MKRKLLLLTLIGSLSQFAFSQQYQQYFDGADTFFGPNWNQSIRIQLLGDSTNIWQIGKPQKNLFDSAATFPNALVTDTIHPYPANNISAFQYSIKAWTDWRIIAIQWKQKLDMDTAGDGGKIEYSIDGGLTWHNVFNNPYVYNFYGYDSANVDTLPGGEVVFNGTDSTWRDIWLCFSASWLINYNFDLRYTFLSDSVDNAREGWMIDNMMAHITIIHTVDQVKTGKYVNVYPNPASDILHIELEKMPEFHLIEHMVLVNAAGQVVGEWTNIPTKFFIDTAKYDSGLYYLRVKTNLREETVPILIEHQQ